MSFKGIPLAVDSPSLGKSIEATSYWLRIGGQSTLPEGSDYDGKLRNMERFNPVYANAYIWYIITVHDFS
jgi:hypothetical protein